jgi:hypothetical protein
MSQRAVAPRLGAEAPNEPMESVKQMRFAPTSAIAASTLRMPPTVTASATSGSRAVSTDRGAARFQTVVFASACALNSCFRTFASRTSTEPTQVPRSPMLRVRLPGSVSMRSVAMTRCPRAVSAAQRRLPIAPAAPMISVLWRRCLSAAIARCWASSSTSETFDQSVLAVLSAREMRATRRAEAERRDRKVTQAEVMGMLAGAEQQPKDQGNRSGSRALSLLATSGGHQPTPSVGSSTKKCTITSNTSTQVLGSKTRLFRTIM